MAKSRLNNSEGQNDYYSDCLLSKKIRVYSKISDDTNLAKSWFVCSKDNKEAEGEEGKG